jgi:ABC-2 type transport system permease protein
MTAQPMTTAGARAASGASLPSAWRIGLARTGIEMKAFFREKQAVVLVFSLPAVLLVLLGSIFRGQAAGGCRRDRLHGRQPGHPGRDPARRVPS